MAAVNGPATVVVSGEGGALEELLACLRGSGVRARRVAVDYASHSVAVEELREGLLEALAGLEPVSCEVPFFSTATGGLLDTAELDGEYWYRSLRERVRFEEATRALAPDACAFVEMSPHPVLTVAVGETLEDMELEGRVGVVGSLRRGEGGLERFVRSLAEAWVVGVPVDWRTLFAGSGAQPVELPTYAFQRARYWLSPTTGVVDVSGAGLGAVDHPLLGAAVALAGGEGCLFTGRLSLDTHPWLADHAVFENVVVVPGMAHLEMVLAAGRAVGCETVEELTFEAPLVLTSGAAVQLQVALGEPEEDGRRRVTVHSCPQARAEEMDGAEGGWTRHASGTLVAGGVDAVATSTPGNADAVLADAAGTGPLEAWTGSQWPPAGAQAVDVEHLYDDLAELGFGYGSAFQGVRAAWRGEGEVYAEVALAEEAAQAARFGVNPALLDAALHSMYCLQQGEEVQPGSLLLPFALSGVTLARQGAASVRVRLVRTGESTLSMAMCDERGEPVLTMRSLALRQMRADQLAGARQGERGSLFRYTGWRRPRPPPPGGARGGHLGSRRRSASGGSIRGPGGLAEEIDAGPPVPEHVFVCASPPRRRPRRWAGGGRTRRCAAGARAVQAWLAHRDRGRVLVIVTRGAVPPGDGEPDLAGAPVRGLVRSAQAEHPVGGSST